MYLIVSYLKGLKKCIYSSLHFQRFPRYLTFHWTFLLGIPALSSHNSPIRSPAKCLLPLGEMPFSFWQEVTGWCLECYQICVCELFSKTFGYNLSYFQEWKPLFYFLQTLEKLIPKYASFNHPNFSPFSEYSSEYTLAHTRMPWLISATVSSLGILPLKCSKMFLLFCFHFVSNIGCICCASCQLPLFLHYKLRYLEHFLRSRSLTFSFQSF